MSPRVWIVASGAGAGATALAAAFRSAARRAGLDVVAFADSEAAHRLVGDPVEPLPRPDALRSRAAVEGPLAVVFSNSLDGARWISAMPPGPLLATLDSTWPIWAWSSPTLFVPVSRIYLFVPSDVVALGSWEEGGPFRLPDRVRDIVLPVGWPEPAPEVSPAAEVLVCLGREPRRESTGWMGALAPAIERIASERPDLRWRCLGGSDVALPPFVERAPWLEPAAFREAVARAALVVCRHGVDTMGAAAAAGTPVVAMSEGLSWRAPGLPSLADQELAVLERAGLVRACFGRAPASALARRMRAALTEGRRAPVDADGAQRAVEDLRLRIGLR